MPYNFNNNSSTSNINFGTNFSNNGTNYSFQISPQTQGAMNTWNQMYNGGFQSIGSNQIKLENIDWNNYNWNVGSFNNGTTGTQQSVVPQQTNGSTGTGTGSGAGTDGGGGDGDTNITAGAPAWLGTVAKATGAATDLASSFTSKKDPGDSNYAIKQTVGNALLQSGNPYAMAAGAAVKGITFAQRAAGKETSNINNAQAKAADIGKGTQIMNTALDFLTLGTGLDFILPQKVRDMEQSQQVDQLRGAYAGTTSNIDMAGTMAGKNYFLGSGKLNNYVDEQNRKLNLLTQIGIDNEQRVSSVTYNADLIAARNFNKLNGATYQGYGTRVGKQGMKMLSREELDKIYAAKKVESDITKLQNGGSILVPEGALHAHKHHMEDVNPELAEDLTKKGIPVVAVDEEGEVTQVAEIEKQELIFEKSLTEEIERLWKDGSEESMIEAGKLITKTLMTNCDDNAGLVKEVE